MIRSTGGNLLPGLLIVGLGLFALAGNLNASEPSMTNSETVSRTVAKNVKQVVGGQDYKGVLEIGPCGIAYVSEYFEWLECIPWSQVLGWKCFGSRHAGPGEEGSCLMWIQLKKDTPHASTHLFFKVPCEMVPGQENWETMESYDPRGQF
jgi:hypothetical protein